MVKLVDVVNSDVFTNDAGEALCHLIKGAIVDEKPITISFSGSSSPSTSFLNSSVGRVIEEFGLDALRAHVDFCDLTKGQASVLRRYLAPFLLENRRNAV